MRDHLGNCASDSDEAIVGTLDGLADLDAGRVCPLDRVDVELRAKYDVLRDAWCVHHGQR